MAKRGEALREHVLWAAKGVFLRAGFARASMDEVAAAAGASKRSLYAHFESKEKLFLAVIAFVRGLFLAKLRMPGDYGDKPSEALARFCGRYLEILLYEGSVQMCRVCVAEAERFPEGAKEHFDVMFTEVHARLTAYLRATFRLPARAGAEAAQRLLGQVLHPRWPRALFGLDPLAPKLDDERIAPDFDLGPVRRVVADFLASLR